MAPGLPLPGHTVITSGAVPEDSCVRIWAWYWSAPLVVKLTFTPGLAASNALTTSSMEPWSTEASVSVLLSPPSLPELALVPLLHAAARVTAVKAETSAANLRDFMIAPTLEINKRWR